ncbi:CPCC family cysteine-rich protein [Permianibacter aggregans]|nr:CPCC family cysteine-rich protein [Permianibacter aggregans]
MFQKKLEWYSPKDPTPRVKCQCCEYISLAESGNYLICPVCFWEDEGMGWELDTPSGANHGLTIREGRANFLKFGACEPEMVKHVVSTEQRKLFEYRPDSNAI